MPEAEEKCCPCFKKGSAGSKCTECGDIFRLGGPPRRGLYIGTGVFVGWILYAFTLPLGLGQLAVIIFMIIGGIAGNWLWKKKTAPFWK